MSGFQARWLVAAALLLPVDATGSTQTPAASPPVETPQVRQERELTALSVTVTVAKFDGDKRVSSVPYVLSVVADGDLSTRIRMGSQIPIVMDAGGPAESFNYKDVGLNIDANARSAGKNRYRLDLGIEDSSVATAGTVSTFGDAGKPGRPVFRSFKANESVLLRDGQSTEFTAATDKLTGEVIKVTVTLVVQK